MTVTCGCWICTGKAHNDGTMHATISWTRALPDTDDEPWDTCEDSGLPDVDRGLWIGWVLLLMAFVAGLVIGKLL